MDDFVETYDEGWDLESTVTAKVVETRELRGRDFALRKKDCSDQVYVPAVMFAFVCQQRKTWFLCVR